MVSLPRRRVASAAGRTAALLGTALFVYVSCPAPAAAQVPDTAAARQQMEQRLGTQVTHAELIDRLRRSGMTRAQVRERLAAAGHDPRLADQYFDVLERGGEPARGVVDDEFLAALRGIGVMPDTIPRDMMEMRRDSIMRADSIRLASGITGEPQVFGREVFRGAGSHFEPVAYGPVSPDYRIGPGDELFIVLTGDVERAYTVDVGRQGTVTIPDVGQVPVNGLTMEMLENQLYSRMGRVYSTLGRGQDATTRLQVSLGRLRASQVFVVGDVLDPGPKQVSSVSGVLDALHWAGGPTERGTFRRIQVRRGETLVGVVDLYDYLLHGDASSDIRLEHGDRVFVPPAGPQVRIEGSVNRPAIYEVIPESEDLRSVIGFAGGLRPDAVVTRIQIDRILPPAQRTAGTYRVIRDVELADLADPDIRIPVEDGDVVRVFAVTDELRQRVWVTGAVNNPGIFEWSRGLPVATIIDRADGLLESAYRPRLLIYRRSPVDGTRSMLRVSAETVDLNQMVLEDGDSVVVLDREELANPLFVAIDGFVKEPGEYPFAAGMTLRDIILEAGGFLPGANVVEADISRPTDPLLRTDTTAVNFRVPLGGTPVGAPDPGAGEWPADGADVPLQAGDRVFIRRAPGYETPALVAVSGEVLHPGTYVLSRRDDRLLDVLRRAGWLTTEANLEGVRVTREGTLVAADVENAFRNPESRSNLVLQPGDSIHVSAYDPTVAVTGAVMFASRVLYRPGMSLSDYLNQAGGTTDIADRDRVTVSYPNGERATVRRTVFIRRVPEIRPGSTINVPVKPEDERDGFNLDQFLTRTLTVLSTVVTLMVAMDRL